MTYAAKEYCYFGHFAFQIYALQIQDYGQRRNPIVFVNNMQTIYPAGIERKQNGKYYVK